MHSYEEWGEDFVQKLRGMFAFAIWDGREEKLILVRDRIGIKPLYYTLLEDKTLLFGSELKAILAHPRVNRSLDPRALDLADKLIHHLGEPFGDFSIFPTYLFSKMARSHVKVILSGDGGDEVFGGYEHYQAQKLSRSPLPFLFRGILNPLIAMMPPLPWMMFLTEKDKKSLYAPGLLDKLAGTKPLYEK